MYYPCNGERIASDQSRCNNVLLKCIFIPLFFLFSVQIRRDCLSMSQLAFSRQMRFLDRTISVLCFGPIQSGISNLRQVWHRRRPCSRCGRSGLRSRVIRSVIYCAEEISAFRSKLQSTRKISTWTRAKTNLSIPRSVLWHVDFTCDTWITSLYVDTIYTDTRLTHSIPLHNSIPSYCCNFCNNRASSPRPLSRKHFSLP